MRKHNFELVEEREMAEVGGTARLWRHAGCGAPLLSITNKDENKCFGVSFYTPPTDSTGVAHILEHSVLCGSAKYPVREPFAELLKGSLQTFLNAFTFPDKTCYPVASANLQDFYNLIDVYLDAVFHPNLTENTFRQEGWHIEAENPDSPWTFKGVVYNEMKGVYSSPDSVLDERSQQALFPDNLYSFDSGGNPECIPDLTWAAFKDFHHRYYQPGNGYFFFWGDDPEDKRLEIIDKAVADYRPIGALPEIPLQKNRTEDGEITIPYAATVDENRALYTLNWLLPERGNISECLKLEMLEHVLEGLPGSPLQRALMESGLGEDTTGGGLQTDLRQMYYSTGLKGIAAGDTGKVKTIILDTLKTLATEGISGEAVEAALNTTEFAYREANTGRFPQGLAAMLLALSTWIHGGNPLDSLAWEKPLADIRSRLSKGDKLLEETIQKYFLDNHSMGVALVPDPNLGEIRESAEKSRLQELREQAGPQKRAQVVEETRTLIDLQLKPDNPEDLAKIPALHLADLPREVKKIPTLAMLEGHHTTLVHELPTCGIAYLTLLLPISRLEKRLIPLLPLFARSLIECGTRKRDFSELGMLIASKTGGLSASILTGARVDTRQPFAFLAITGKCLYGKMTDLAAIMHEILLERQNDRTILAQRIGLMLLEAKARLEQGFQFAGHAAISLRLSAHFGGEGALAEDMNGITQLQSVRAYIEQMEANPGLLLNDLDSIAASVISGKGAIFDCAARKPGIDMFYRESEKLLKALPEAPSCQEGVFISQYPAMSNLPHAEAFITPGQINYVGKGGNLYDYGYTFNGAANVIFRWLRMGRLWEDVRVAGGAYGAFCNFDRTSGTLVCASYRDPNIERTLAVYDDIGTYMATNTPDTAQLEQAIIGAVGAQDTYLLPDAAAARALALYLSGMTTEMRQETRDQMFATTDANFVKLGEQMKIFAQKGDICVLGGPACARAAKENDWVEYRLV